MLLPSLTRRTMPAEGVEPISPHPASTSSPGSTVVSTSGAISIAVVAAVLLLLLSLTGLYYIYWRHRKTDRSPQGELEIGEDGTKIKMEIQKERTALWGRRGSGESQDTLVPGEVRVPKSVVVRERSG